MPPPARTYPFGHILFILFPALLRIAHGSIADGNILKSFMASADIHHKLQSNWTGDEPCLSSWVGVHCSSSGEITGLVLDSINMLGGTISHASLCSLPRLSILNLNGNGLMGFMPLDLSSCIHLTHLSLSYNNLSGSIPSTLPQSIKRLDLSHNALSGNIPLSLASLSSLISLHLQNNLFIGSIPELQQQALTDLDVSNNRLSGHVPESLKRFKQESFAGNVLLCGEPVSDCRHSVSLTGLSLEQQPNQTAGNSTKTNKKSSVLGTGLIIEIVIADIAVLFFISLLCAFCYKMKEKKMKQENTLPKVTRLQPEFGSPGISESSISARSPATGTYDEVSVVAKEQYNPQLVTFEGQTFKLQDLLRASAEFVGNGSLGAVYKATMEDGTAAAVKRLRTAGIGVGMHEFIREIETVGRLRHPNVVPMWAYYYGKEKKILVYEYEPYGNLFTLLHGLQNATSSAVEVQTQTPQLYQMAMDCKPLSWTNRIRIARGVANGLAFLHQQKKEPHGNIKATNILINRDFEACIGDYGLAALVEASVAETHMVGYKAPEFQHGSCSKITMKTDVYSFGVLLLELLTGKLPDYYCSNGCVNLPRWVNVAVRQEWTTEIFDPNARRGTQNDEALVSMLKIAMACVSTSPETRPSMNEVVGMIMEEMVQDYHDQDPDFTNYCSSVGSYTPRYPASPMSSILLASP